MPFHIRFKTHIFPRIFLFFLLLAGALAANAQETWERRAELEQKWRQEGLTLIPYRLNYFLPYTYNTSPHPSAQSREQYEEAKFQISFKVLLLQNLLRTNSHLYFGYTQLALWQVYDQDRSAPFRDTNYEPELMLTFSGRREFGPFSVRQIDFGLSHQSNGTQPPDSRTWNRFYGKFYFDKKGFLFTLKPWIRFHDAPSQKDNPDIDRYMGYGEATVSYGWKNHILSVLLRNNLESQNRGAIQVEYTFPLTKSLTGLMQYFSGYGESLIDYNRPNNRYGIGIALSDWH